LKQVLLLLFLCAGVRAAVLASIRGIVHDPDHRPIPNATVRIHTAGSDYSQELTTGVEGAFQSAPLPVGEYVVTVRSDGFAASEQAVTVTSGSAPVLHFQLAIGVASESVTVAGEATAVDEGRVTPTTMISRADIQTTPGADLTNSLALITDYVPGSWVTHDQLHVRGGHQVTWAIDGVSIPNTNIASNVGPQIDPKDIDYLEAQRGGYSSDYGDRTYGVFNVVPRTGFERNNEGEVYLTYGSFNQTNEQFNIGSHTQRLAYFASVNGNRTDYGLAAPGPDIEHDRAWGLGGLVSLIYNRDASNQFRFFSTLRRDDYQIPSTSDLELERDAVADFTWAHTFRPSLLLTVSPFYHHNTAAYEGSLEDYPISPTQRRSSDYGGAQISLNATTNRHTAKVGVYGFGQHDHEFVGLTANDGSGTSLNQEQISTGHLEAAFLEDQYKVCSWLTITGGVRLTHFSGAISENAASPRSGVAVRIPHLNWVFHGFWGRYYQPPPLSTVDGPLLEFAASNGFGFIPLRGERDTEHQYGVTIPVRGWSVDVNNYHQRASNYFDHNSIGNSNVFFPLTIQSAKLYGWEVSLRSPRLRRTAEFYLTYAYAHALGAGAVTGGLTDFSPPENGYFLLDHDQRHTLHTGFHATLPWRIAANADVYYGSGFTDGSSDVPAHLPGHTTFDATVGRSFGERLTLSVTALNAANRRFMLDNSETFGGTHYADPRQVYVQIRYRFRY
jgi:outer membrane receptor for ferrienterochelin and colicin